MISLLTLFGAAAMAEVPAPIAPADVPHIAINTADLGVYIEISAIPPLDADAAPCVFSVLVGPAGPALTPVRCGSVEVVRTAVTWPLRATGQAAPNTLAGRVSLAPRPDGQTGVLVWAAADAHVELSEGITLLHDRVSDCAGPSGYQLVETEAPVAQCAVFYSTDWFGRVQVDTVEGCDAGWRARAADAVGADTASACAWGPDGLPSLVHRVEGVRFHAGTAQRSPGKGVSDKAGGGDDVSVRLVSFDTEPAR